MEQGLNAVSWRVPTLDSQKAAVLSEALGIIPAEGTGFSREELLLTIADCGAFKTNQDALGRGGHLSKVIRQHMRTLLD